jgi:hypothetical protein
VLGIKPDRTQERLPDLEPGWPKAPGGWLILEFLRDYNGAFAALLHLHVHVVMAATSRASQGTWAECHM